MKEIINVYPVFVHLLIASSALTYAIAKSKAFKPMRELISGFVKKLQNTPVVSASRYVRMFLFIITYPIVKFEQLINCTFCTGFWCFPVVFVCWQTEPGIWFVVMLETAAASLLFYSAIRYLKDW